MRGRVNAIRTFKGLVADLRIEKKFPNLLVFGTKKRRKTAKSDAIRLQNDAVHRAKSYKQPCEMPQITR